MPRIHTPKPTQATRILAVLQHAKGKWVNGRKFVQEMLITQFHSRIFELERQGYRIEHSEFRDAHGFVSYRLLSTPKKKTGVAV